MILRLFALLIACVCLAGRADAVPIFRLQPSSPLDTVQDRSEKRDVWRSPRNLKNFPFIGEDDCTRYGRKNSYPECEGTPPEKPTSNAAVTPERPAIQKPQLVPIPVRRAKILDDEAASPWQSGITTSEEPLAASASAEDGFAKTLGALLIVTFEGRSAVEDGPKRVADALRQGRIGGVLLRHANIESPAQLKALTAFLAKGQSQAPLILIEHSGGSDNTLAHAAGFQSIASPREIGARGDALEAFSIYEQMAESLAAVGVSLNVGPSASACRDDASAATMDCFGSDPRHSAAFATAFNLAHESQGVLTAMRYQAPVEGDGTALDEMAKRKAPDALVVDVPTENSSPGVRMANTLRPAGYSGAILLDSVDEQGAAEKLVDAINHGADMVLFRTAPDLEAGLPDTALAGIRSAISAGRLAQTRLDDAVSHAASLRQQAHASQSRIVSRAGLADQSSPTR
jgi:hypothetical protein